MIDINLHTNFDEINEDDWNGLLLKSSTNVPFLRQGYLKSWWEYKGGGEWKNGELAIISARKGGQLIGIAPLFTTIHGQKKKLLFLGSIEISDYLDFIFDPAYGDAFFEALSDFVAGEKFADIESLLLYNLPDDSPSLQFLEKAGERLGWKLQSERAYHTPAIELAGDWETYLAGIDKKQRHEIRRKLRRAEESPEAIAWYEVKERDVLDEEIAGFFDLMVLDPDKKGFLSDAMRAQMDSIIRWAFDENLLQLSFLTIVGRKAAAYLCFDYQNQIWVYNSGFDPEFRDYSPGWIMLSYLIQHAIQSGKKVFDFMRGDEDYKYRFGAADGFVMKVELSRRA